MNTLRDILSSAETGEVLSSWIDARENLLRDRESVEEFIAHGHTVYGFNTRLGELDRAGLRGAEVDEHALLAGHLLGPESYLKPYTLNLVTACKIQQLSLGGSGIALDTYDSLLQAHQRKISVGGVGCWSASYGAGDVVPASWWVKWLGDKCGLNVSRPGDVISLINGNFFATAIALEAAAGYVETIANVIAYLAQEACASGGNSTGWSSSEAWRVWDAMRGSSASADRTQLPISLRDADPVARALFNSVIRLGRGVADRLSLRSANPLVVADESLHKRVLSQNSFLDFGLTFAIGEAVHVTCLGVGMLQRLVLHRIKSIQSEKALSIDLVQPPKILNALLAAGQQQVHHAGSYVGSDSEEIEDVRDMSLIAAMNLSRMVEGVLSPAVKVAETIIPSGSSFQENKRLVMELFNQEKIEL